MGKNYAESSLKHYLKQKVRITLGVVVAFLITGSAVFSVEQEPNIEGKGVYIPYNKWLEGIGTQKEDILKNDIVIKNDNAEIDFTISKELINDNKGLLSTETIKNINNSLELIDNAINKKTDFDENKLAGNNGAYQFGLSGIGEINTEDKTFSGVQIKDQNYYVNKGFLNRNNGNVNQTAIIMWAKNSQTFNYGIIKAIGHAQGLAASDSEAYNYGIILAGNGGQTAFGNGVGDEDKVNMKLLNYGYIAGSQYMAANEGVSYNYGIINNGSQEFDQNKTQQGIQKGYNYGILISNDNGQKAFDSNVELENFGLIISGEAGQTLTSNKKSIAINYGIIKSEKNGQYLSSTNSDNIICNYGLIESKEIGQENYSNNGKSYNYGIIKNSASDKNHAAIKNSENKDNTENKYAENSGLIIADTGHAFNGEVTNNGIVLSKTDILENKGANQVDKTTNNGVYIITKDSNTTVEVSDETENLTDSKKISEIQKIIFL